MKGLVLTLRKPELTDVPIITQWFQDPSFGEYLFDIPDGQHHTTVMSLLNHNAKDTSTQITMIAENDAKEPIGLLFYKNISWKHRNAEINTLIGDTKHRSGIYGPDLYLLGITYAFSGLNLHKVFGYTYMTNKAAMTLTQNIAKTSGILYEHIRRDGVYINTTVFSILKKDFRVFLKDNNNPIFRKFIKTGVFEQLLGSD
jgi:RimJ/RimL family protein N-acetyltransferase